MSWDYSDLSHIAKEKGGPEKFVKDLENFNYNNGFKDGKSEQARVDLALVGIAVFGGFALYLGRNILYKFIQKQIEKAKEPKITATQAAESRKQLIQGLNDADAAEHTIEDVSEEEVDMKLDNEKGQMCKAQQKSSSG